MAKYRILIIILFAGFLLRLIGIWFGLPYQFHQDEPIVVNHALAYGTGDLNPHFFAIPPFVSYILFFIYGVIYLAGNVAGQWSGSGGFVMWFLKDPSCLYLAGRFFIGVVPGVLGIFFIYRLAVKFMSRRAALFSAAVTAFSFLNVVNSHYIYTDMLLVLFIILAFSRFCDLYDKGTLKDYFLSGIFIGLATGTKYNGIMLLFPLLFVHIAVSARDKSGPVGERIVKILFGKNIWLCGLAAFLTFTATNPFFVLDFRSFYSLFSKQCGAFWYIGPGYHLFYSLIQGMSMVIVIPALAGICLLFFRDGRTRMMLSFPVLYYMLLIFRSQPFARYVLPLVPFMALGAAYFIFDVIYPRVRSSKYGRILFAGMVLFLLAPSLMKSVKADMLLSGKDTRIMAAVWIENNLPRGSAIACDSTFFRPALAQPYSQLVLKKRILAKKDPAGSARMKKLGYLMAGSDRKDPGYPLYFIFEHHGPGAGFTNTWPSIAPNMEKLRALGIKYVSIGEQRTGLFVRELKKQALLLKEFSPYGDTRISRDIDATATTCLPVMSRDIFLRKMTGPIIRIYRLK